MKTTHLLTSLTLFSAGCFPATPIDWGEVEELAPPEAGNLEPFGPSSAAALTPTRGQSLLADCQPASTGLVAEMVSSPARLGVGPSEISGRPDAPFLQDGFANEVALFARQSPMAVGCVETGVAQPLVSASSAEGGVGDMIRHAADALADTAWAKAADDRVGLEAAAKAICARFVPEPGTDAAGNPVAPDVSNINCGPSAGELPAELEAALAPVMWAIHDGVVARLERDEDLAARDPAWWRDNGGKNLLASSDDEAFNPDFDEDRNFLSAEKGKLYGAAAAIADAVQSVDWGRFRGQDVTYDLETPAGWVRIRGSADDRYDPAGQDSLLLVDLGGNDIHFDQVASNTSGNNAVSVVIDVGGDDRYEYDAAENASLDGPRLPADRDGVVTKEGLVADATASQAARQGAARHGIAMLFDLGAGTDRYVALRASQGYAQQGVGVLFDDGGSDIYLAEEAAQGAGQFGIGLAVDLGNEPDVRRSSRASQGFGYVGGVGVVFDAGGNDQYECHPDHNGNPAYVAPQMPGRANASVCQGAGLGFRVKDERYSMAGGVGILVDVAGDDTYRAGVYAQGVGYWQGFGLLADLNGSDSYDAFYYAQGASAHFGVGYFADGGEGSDTFGANLDVETMVLGAAQDFSVAVFVNEKGDDEYNMPDAAAGLASCGSVAIFVDNAGTDRYLAPVGQVAGVARAQACGANTDVVSHAVFLDVGGQDDWQTQGGRGNDNTWAEGGSGGARAFARDVARGDSGLHVGLR